MDVVTAGKTACVTNYSFYFYFFFFCSCFFSVFEVEVKWVFLQKKFTGINHNFFKKTSCL